MQYKDQILQQILLEQRGQQIQDLMNLEIAYYGDQEQPQKVLAE